MNLDMGAVKDFLGGLGLEEIEAYEEALKVRRAELTKAHTLYQFVSKEEAQAAFDDYLNGISDRYPHFTIHGIPIKTENGFWKVLVVVDDSTQLQLWGRSKIDGHMIYARTLPLSS
jgi:hypothetical protein